MFDFKNIKELNELEVLVYNFVIEHLDEVTTMSIQEFAQRSHVSTTTILRTCKKLGFNGYSELKVRISDETKKNKAQLPTPYFDNISFLEKYFDHEFQKKLQTIANEIQQCKGIVWMGFGASAGLCKYGANYFANTQKVNFVIDDPYFHSNGELFDNFILIILSVSGEIDNTIRILNSLKSKQMKTISITNYDNSTLSKLSTYTIPYYVPYNKAKDIDMTTQLPVMLIIEMLANMVIKPV